MEKEQLKTDSLEEQEFLNQPKEIQETSLDKQIEENLQKDLKERLVSEDGMIADQYDHIPDTEAITEAQQDEFSDKIGIKLEYEFNADEVSRGLRIFQKFTIYKKNLIYSLIIAVLFLVFLAQVIQNPEHSNAQVFVCVITIVALGMIWYTPWNHIHQTAKVIANQKEPVSYLMTIYDNAIVTGDGDDRNVFYFKDNKMKVWEMADMYVFGYNKVRIFVVPKRCCQGREEEISILLRQGLGANYRMVY